MDLLQKATPVIDTTYYKAPELAEAQLNTTIFIDPSNPFSESVLAKILRKVSILTSLWFHKQPVCSPLNQEALIPSAQNIRRTNYTNSGG